MPKLYARNNGGEITSDWDESTFSNLFPESEWSKVYNTDNVIDIIILDRKSRFYSVSPKLFAANAKSGDVVRDYKYFPAHGLNLRKPITEKSWGDNAETILKTMSNALGADDDNDLHLKDENWGWRNDLNKAAAQYDNYMEKNENDPTKYGVVHDGANYYQFPMLYNDLTSLDYAMKRGYQLFRPDEFRHAQNWMIASSIDYPDTPSDYYRHFIVMYLDAKTAALHLGCFNPSRTITPDFSSAIKSLFRSDKLNNQSQMLTIGDTFCTEPLPKYSYWESNSKPYQMGQYLFSPDSSYKCMIQPDGNFTIWKMSNSTAPKNQDSKWSTGTRLKQYDETVPNGSKKASVQFTRPNLYIQGDGNIVIESRRGAVIQAFGTSGKNVRLALTNDGVIIVYANNDPIGQVLAKKNGTPNQDWLKTVYDKAIWSGICQPDSNTTAMGYKTMSARLAYCKKDLRMATDDKCKVFWGKLDSTQDSADGGVIKTDADNHVASNVCTTANVNSSSSDRLRKFCSGYIPYDTACATLQSKNVPLACTAEAVKDSAYRSKSMLNQVCNMQICIQDQSLINVAAEGITNTCTITNNNGSSGSTASDAQSTNGSTGCDLTNNMWGIGSYKTGAKLYSPNGYWYATIDSNGHLIVNSNTDNKTYFKSDHADSPNAMLSIQKDGNIVIYKETGGAIWNTKTQNKGSDMKLAVDNNHVLFAFNGTYSGTTTWQSDTATIDFTCQSTGSSTDQPASTTNTTSESSTDGASSTPASSSSTPASSTSSSTSSSTPASSTSSSTSSSTPASSTSSSSSTPASSATTVASSKSATTSSWWEENQTYVIIGIVAVVILFALIIAIFAKKGNYAKVPSYNPMKPFRNLYNRMMPPRPPYNPMSRMGPMQMPPQYG
jgi:hypothetical protein